MEEIILFVFDLRGRGCCGKEGFRDHEADRHTSDSLTTLLFQDNLQVCWFSNVQEILWVLTPKLVFFAFLINSFATTSGWAPFALELLLDGVW